MAYSAVKDANGNYVISNNGQRISTGTAATLQNYGLSETQLTSQEPAPTAVGQQVTEQAAAAPTPPPAAPAPTAQPYTPPTPASAPPAPNAPATNADGSVQSTNPNTQQYSFKTLPNGNIDILENGKSISQGGPGFPASYAASLGYSAPSGQVLGASTASPTVAPTQVGSNGKLAQNVQSAMSGPTIPSTALGAGTNSGEVLAKANGLYESYKSHLDQLAQAKQPSAEELDLQKRIKDLTTATEKGIVHLKGQAIPTPLIGLQSQKLQEDYATKIRPLQDELDTLVKARSAQIDAITSVLQSTPEMINLLGNIQKLTQPNVLSTQVNDATGDVYAIVQDPQSGAVQTMKIGSVGQTAKAKQYVSSGVYQAGDGSQFFYGVGADGTITNTQLQGAPQTGVAGGFTLGTNQTRFDAQGNPIASTVGDNPTSTTSFSSTQLNKGASNAGLPIADFQKLDHDTQNFFVNVPSQITTAVNAAIADPTKRTSTAESIQSSNLSDSVKQILLNKIGASNQTAAAGGIVDSTLGALGGAWDWLRNTLGI